jgi:hypothetical protein
MHLKAIQIKESLLGKEDYEVIYRYRCLVKEIHPSEPTRTLKYRYVV